MSVSWIAYLAEQEVNMNNERSTGATDDQLHAALRMGMRPDGDGWAPLPLALKRDIAKVAALLVPPGWQIVPAGAGE